jgi:N-carbamoylputrescine amidase
MVKKTTIGLIQTKVFDNQNKNIENSVIKIKEAAKKKAKIICLPELFLSPYFCQSENHAKFKLAEKIPGRLSDIYCKLAKELSVVLMISLFEKKTTGFYHNTSIVIDDKGKIISKYRKMHIPDDPGYYEKFYFTPGDLGFKSTKTKYGKVGSLICWDQWFPEAARLTTLKGAEILFYPTAIGWHPKEKKQFGKSQLDAWITIQRSHAIANGVFVAAINRIGLEKTGKRKIHFWGNSMIIDPSGNIIAKSKSDKEEILITIIDLNKIETDRNHWQFLRDIRIDYYKGLLKNPKDE